MANKKNQKRKMMKIHNQIQIVNHLTRITNKRRVIPIVKTNLLNQKTQKENGDGSKETEGEKENSEDKSDKVKNQYGNPDGVGGDNVKINMPLNL